MYEFTCVQFQSTLLVRGATCRPAATISFIQFQSTLLVRGATYQRMKQFHLWEISIHAPRERSDFGCLCWMTTWNISIHAPRERSDFWILWHFNVMFKFQSTLLVRGATGSLLYDDSVHKYFNPRSSWEERPSIGFLSIAVIEFQSTLLVRGATTVFLLS